MRFWENLAFELWSLILKLLSRLAESGRNTVNLGGKETVFLPIF